MAMEQRLILLISGTAHELGGLRFLLFRTFQEVVMQSLQLHSMFTREKIGHKPLRTVPCSLHLDERIQL